MLGDDLKEDIKVNKFVIVLHNYWMDHISWEKIISKAETYKEAENEAKYLRSDRTKQFNHCDYTIVGFEVNAIK